jgi:hypothetical protein
MSPPIELGLRAIRDSMRPHAKAERSEKSMRLFEFSPGAHPFSPGAPPGATVLALRYLAGARNPNLHSEDGSHCDVVENHPITHRTNRHTDGKPSRMMN